MDIQQFLDNVHDLTDLELAVLLSLIAQQSCLITTEEDLIDDLSSELALISSEVFKLSYAVVSLDDALSVEKFGEAILDQNHLHHDFAQNDPSPDSFLAGHSRVANVAIRAASVTSSHLAQVNLDSRTVANVVVAKNFNHAPREVQIAALELSTRRRIYSRTTVHQVPKVFIFIPLVATSSKHVRLTDYLNERISMSHHHDPADGFANLEELEVHSVVSHDLSDDDNARHPYPNSEVSNHLAPPPPMMQYIDHRVINRLREMGNATTMTPEIRRYIQDIAVFLRMARGVDGGVTPFTTTQFVNLAKYLAPLHGIDFVTPSLVALAARKVYPHKLVITDPYRERSMQWGSDLADVIELLKDETPERIIESVLDSVTCPV